MLLGGAVVLFMVGCAKISAPVGGVVDKEPPQVISTSPEPFAVVPGWDQPVVIRFDERISEKQISESVLVSPETGKVRVRKGRSELKISVAGGWRPGQIYTVVVLPVVQDLFNNSLKSEIELIFSTGPEIPATAAAGMITDRITGKPVAGARVEAISEVDSVSYVALSDTAGFFALRHIPAGGYAIQAYLDRNRSGVLDFGEPQDTGSLLLGATDTMVVSYVLLPADTTPARLTRAEERDTMQVRLTLDDYLDPLESLAGVRVEIRELPDSTLIPGARVEQVYEFERWRAEQRAAEERADAEKAAEMADSAKTAPDTVGVAADTAARAVSAADTRSRRMAEARVGAAAAETRTAGARAAERAAGTAGAELEPPLPVRELVVVPETPLKRKTRYLITISGIRNINGIEGGGGSAVFETAAAIPLDTTEVAPVDSSASPPPPDSTGTGPSALLRGWISGAQRQ